MEVARTAPAVARAPSQAAGLVTENVSAWFGDHKVLHRVNLEMQANQVTSLIGPSGCGKSTFLRILNRMHELVPSASLSGTVRIDGIDIYRSELLITDIRRRIGMVFQKPNPFPAMSVAENVVAGLKLGGHAPVAQRGAGHGEDLPRARRAVERGEEPARRCRRRRSPVVSSNGSASRGRSR